MANQDMSSVIVERRKALRMTQRDLAEKLNVSDQTVSRWETGASYPDASIIPALADVLQVDIAVLFSRTSKEGVLGKEDQTDYKTITKFRIFIGIAAALIVCSAVFAFCLNYTASQNGPRTALLIVSALFAIAGAILAGASLFWFRSFYKGKFYNERYRGVFYHSSLLLSLSVLPLLYAIALHDFGVLGSTNSFWLTGIAVVTLALFLALIPWGRKREMAIEWNGKTITFFVLGILFTLSGCAFIVWGVALAQLTAFLLFQVMGIIFDTLFLMRAKPRKN